MKIEFEKSFYKSLEKVVNASISKKLISIIEQTEETTSIDKISSIKKLSGYKTFYRIRLGEYRIGIEFIKPDTVLFIIISHRKDIYNRFP
jgi:mRNA interferase RelE/StbE